MKKRTLFFDSPDLVAAFSRTLSRGYLLNTANCSITAAFSTTEIEAAMDHYQAHLTLTSERSYSYMPSLSSAIGR